MMRESTETGMDSLITQFWVKSLVETRGNDVGVKKKHRVIKRLERLASSPENTKITFKLKLEHCSQVYCAAAGELIQLIT